MQQIRFLTKVRLPQRRPDVLRRPRLVDFLHESVDKRLIMVVAAAGYGKTTLLVDFAHDSGLPVCWYSLDATDTDPRAFFEYLILALRRQFPEFGKQTEALLASLTDVTKDTNSLVASLVNDIQTDIPDYFVLVLDDFHWMDDAEAISSAIDLLIYYLPDNCHLVIASRSLPRLTYSRLAALRQVAGLGTSDLRFTTDEVTRLLRDNYKLALPGHQAEEIISASEGWIAGILLTTHTLWMGLVESIVKAKGAGSPLFDYLANEAYLQQQPEVQRFLLSSAVLDAMSPDLCDRLFANGAAREMLENVSRANLFIERIDGEGDWYRYHNLFQSFLTAKLKAEDPNLHSALHLGAARLAEEVEDWDRALRHYEEAGALADAAHLVERVGEEVLRAGRWRTLYRWLDSLPASTVDRTPRLGQFRGRTYLWAGENDRAIAHFTRSAERFLQAGNPEDAGSCLTLKGGALRMKGRFSEAVAECTRALEIQKGKENRVAAEAYRDIGICLASQGKLAEAAAELEKALRICELLADESGTATISEAMGIIAVRLGNVAKGMAYYQEALSRWRKMGSAPSIANALNSIAMVYLYTGELAQAQKILEEALTNARAGAYLRAETAVLGSLAHVQRETGALQASQETYEAGLDIAHRVDDIQQVLYQLDGLANTHRLQGDYATAERLLRQGMQQAEEAQSHYDVACLNVSMGVLAEEQGDVVRAERLLRRAVEQLAASGARRDLARARFHLARTLFARGRKGPATREMNSCIELCQELGYDQFMVSEGERAEALISWAISEGLGGRRLELVAERLRQRGTDRPRIARRPRIRLEKPRTLKIEVHSFGESKVVIDSRVISSSEWAVEKTRELFFYLLQQPGSLRKDQIVDKLWPELDPGKSNSQFHSTVYRLRQATFPQALAFKDGRYALALGKGYWYDAEEFARLLEQARNVDPGSPAQIDAYEAAVALYKGPFLEEMYSEWVQPIRDELEERYVRALNELARLRAIEGSFDRALQLLRSALSTDPFQEEAHYGLIHYSALLGDRGSALRYYRNYVELLRDELGARPSKNVTALADLIAAGQPVPTAEVSAS